MGAPVRAIWIAGLALAICALAGPVACNKPAEYYALKDRDKYVVPSAEPSAEPSEEPSESPADVSGEPSDISSDPADISEDPRREIVSPTDMVLLYGGNRARTPYTWTSDRLMDYVSYVDREGKWHWLFDGFLLLELKTESKTRSVCFASGYRSWDGEPLPSATKADWEKLLDYYFASTSGLSSIETAVEKSVKQLGEPPRKRMVVMSIPEPILRESWSDASSSSVYWGEVDGTQMDFSLTPHRNQACKWFVDSVISRFGKKNFKYLELTGFYWLPEDCGSTSDLIGQVASYVNDMGYSLNWIPYYHAEGYTRWKSFGFNYAYYQPNYFFYDVPESRVATACTEAAQHGLAMELEFDSDALASVGKGNRLRSYMSAFRKYGAWESQNMAYYQGGWAVRDLKESAVEEDNDLYHDFCEFVITRPIRDSH